MIADRQCGYRGFSSESSRSAVCKNYDHTIVSFVFSLARPFTGQRELSEPSSFGRSVCSRLRERAIALFSTNSSRKKEKTLAHIRSPISSFGRGLASMYSLSLSLSLFFPFSLFLGANLKIDTRDERSSMCNERMHEAWNRGSGAWIDAMRRSLGKLTVSQT